MINKIAATILGFTLLVGANSCRKEGCTDSLATNYDSKAKKEDGSCVFTTPSYPIPTTYNFTDAAGNSTVSYTGQTDRLNQLEELIAKLESGETTVLNVQDLLDMYQNTGGNGNGNFSFSSIKQLKDKTFLADQNLIETWLNNAAVASQSFASAASNGQAGTLTSGTSTYLFDANGFDCAERVEKGLMGAIFMDQALNIYFGSSKMNVDNTTAVDASNGLYYTTMAHHWDEAFGYFGVPTTFPTVLATGFWGQYCNAQNATLNSNADMMNNFLKGRTAIVAMNYADRDAAIQAIRKEWEDISAYQAMNYINVAIANFGSDNAKYLHALTEAYGFAWNLRYASLEARRMSNAEHTTLMNSFGTNLWNLTIADLNAIKSSIDAKY